MSESHCVDCCCARSWAALGITEFTGRSIPEEIAALREQLAEAEERAGLNDDRAEEWKRMHREAEARLHPRCNCARCMALRLAKNSTKPLDSATDEVT